MILFVLLYQNNPGMMGESERDILSVVMIFLTFNSVAKAVERAVRLITDRNNMMLKNQ